MKSKKFTIYLVAAVVVVWGLIIYRVVAANLTNDDVAPVPVAPVKEAYNDFTIPKDTTNLLLNYRDPFGIVKQKDTNTKVRIFQKVTSNPKIIAPAMNWSFITYSGYIRNPASKLLVSLVTINGQSFAMQEGDSREKVKLLKNKLDSIEISYGGKIKYIIKR